MRAAILNGSNVVVRVVMLDSLSQIPGSINGTGADVGDTWDGATFVRPQKTLAQAKRDARDALAVRLIRAEQSSFAFQTGRVVADAAMLSRIAILALRAQRAIADSEAITVRIALEDGSTLNLNRQEMLDLAKAAGDHFIACSANARTLRQAINAAATLAEVYAVDIESGWPA